MKRNNKKGFTIVELTIVIAVIAILAAVLIPTFSSVVDKANQSADVQLVRQANVVLQAATANGSSLSEKDAIKELENNSIKLDKPSKSDCVFYYLESENRYVIFDTKEEKMTYPEDMVEKYKDKAVSSWLKYEITLDYQINQKFKAETDDEGFYQYADTGFYIDWNQNFTITEEFEYTPNQMILPLGSYSTNKDWGDNPGLDIRIKADGIVEVWIYDRLEDSKKVGNGKCKLVFRWNATSKTYTAIITQDGQEKVKYADIKCDYLKDKGKEAKTMRVGATDHRETTGGEIDIKSFQITYTVSYGETLDLLEVKSNIDGYTCKGWFDAASNGTKLENFEMPAENTTIYAHWTE